MNEMTNDELRIAIAKAKYERVEVRGCEFSPDCGDLNEVQSIDVRYPQYRTMSDRYILWPCWFESSFTDEDVVYEHWVPVPDWPNDIAAAWELFDELPRVRELYDCPDGSITFVCGGKDTYMGLDGGYRANADTATLAISRAWLIWKTEAE